MWQSRNVIVIICKINGIFVISVRRGWNPTRKGRWVWVPEISDLMGMGMGILRVWVLLFIAQSSLPNLGLPKPNVCHLLQHFKVVFQAFSLLVSPILTQEHQLSSHLWVHPCSEL